MAHRRPAPSTLPFQVLSVDQKKSTPLSPVPYPQAEVQYLYRPSYDSLVEGVEGQDYVTVANGDGLLLFAVCDGVGQSFFGQLAAKFLGDALIDWLRSLDQVTDERDLAARLAARLARLAAAGQRHVDAYPLPDDLPPLVRSAWEDQRAYGSETMFVCGRLHFASGPGRAGAGGQCVLCWLGDSEVQIFDRDSAPVDLGAEWSSRERWSTRQGIKGAESPHVWIGDLDQIGQIIAYTDGLKSVKAELRRLLADSQALQHEMDRLYAAPDSDDISLVSISPRRVSPPLLLAIDNPWYLGSYTLRWQPVPGADGYLVEQARDPLFRQGLVSWVSRDTHTRVQRQAWGRYFYRVRALAAGMQSEPGNVLGTRVLLTLSFRA